MQLLTEPRRIFTGVSGMDVNLSGGLPEGHTYLVEGSSGSGKTTMGMQFVTEGRRTGESCLYVTLSESTADLKIAAESHGWSLDGIAIAEFVPDEASLKDEQHYTVFHPGEVELAPTTKKLLAGIERAEPDRLVVDSLSEFRLLAGDSVKFRRQLLVLKQFFAQRNTAVLLLNDCMRRAISVLKKRSGAHGSTIRELRFSSVGIQVGEPLAEFKSILSGLPDSVQAREPHIEES
jgi:circadian clock protein KaiC